MLVKVAAKILAHILSVLYIVYADSLSSEHISVDGIKIQFSALIFLAWMCFKICAFLHPFIIYVLPLT